MGFRDDNAAICGACNGEGTAGRFTHRPCPVCHGSGEVDAAFEDAAQERLDWLVDRDLEEGRVPR